MPAGSSSPAPGERDLRTRGGRLVVPFHGEGEHRVFILRLTRLVHADVSAHRRAAAVAVRFTRQLLAANAEGRIRRGVFNARQLRQRGNRRINDVVQLSPVNLTVVDGAVQRMQPAPAFQHYGFRVVVSRIVNLEETLGATFVVHHGTVAFRKACRGEHQVRFVHNRGALMIHHHHQRRFRQRSVNARGGSMTVKVVFQHDNRVCGAAFQFVQRLFKRAAADHAQSDAVNRPGDHGHPDIGAAAFQSFRHVSGGLDDLHAAGVGPGDDQRFFRPGQRLNDNVDFTLQVWLRPSTAGALSSSAWAIAKPRRA